MKGKRVAVAAGAVALVVLAIAAYLCWPRIRFLIRFKPLGLNTQGMPEYCHRQTGIVFVRLPGGKFWMGAQRTDPNGQNYDPEAMDDEGPVHEVTLGPFLIAKYELAQAQWMALMGSNPSRFTFEDDMPVDQVSWDDIQEFEERMGLLLPTEAQWEYACRAGSTTPISGTGKLDDMGWYDENSGNMALGAHPVGGKAPNRFGLQDLHGNVCEWCEDVYGEGFYGRPEAREPDPVSVSGSGLRVIRGGCWGLYAGSCRASTRVRAPRDDRNVGLGFRLASRAP